MFTRSFVLPSNHLFSLRYLVPVAAFVAVAGSAAGCSSSNDETPNHPDGADSGAPSDAGDHDASTTDDSDVVDAGCGACPAPAHGSATCTEGACRITCEPGFIPEGSECATVTDWMKQFGTTDGDSADAVAVDANGNIFVAGGTDGTLPGQTNAGIRDAYVVKLDASGNIVWNRQFGSSEWDEVHAVAVDASGNVFVAGRVGIGGALAGQTNVGKEDAYVVKLDTSGNVVWTRQFGTNRGDSVEAMALDANGNIFVSGYTKGTLPGQTPVNGDGDAYVAKLDASGNVVWTRQFGSSGWDGARAVAVGGDGHVFAAGDTNDALSGQTNLGHEDAFVVHLDASGNVVWTRQFGSSEIDFANAIGVDASGNVVVAGETDGTLPGQTGAGKRDAFVVTWGASGDAIWTRQFGSSSNDNDYANALAIAADGKIFVTGVSNGVMPGQTGALAIGAYALALDPSGTTVWTRQFGGASARSIAVAASGKVFVAGQVDGALFGQTNLGGSDAFVVQMSP